MILSKSTTLVTEQYNSNHSPQPFPLSIMSFDQEFLTPRGLLVNKSFVCEGPSFSRLIVAINNMMSVPYTKEQVLERFGFSNDGMLEA